MIPLLLILAAGLSFAQCTTSPPGICNTGLSTVQNNLLGPLVPFGSSPWTFFDAAEKGVSDYLGMTGVANAPVLGTALSGTVSFVQGNNFITTTADLTTPLSGQTWVVAAWTSIDGTATGRYQCPILSVTSTQINCTESGQEPSFSGATAYLLAPAANPYGIDSTYWTTENPSYTWNYYDVAIAFYRMFYRTTTSTYQTYARDFADYNWQWNLDHGYRRVSPRASAMISQFFRTLDGHSERLPGLYNWITIQVPLWADPSGIPNVDVREAGYMLWNIALGAKVDTDPTRHAQYCSWLTTYTPIWNSKQNADGSWSENDNTYGNYAQAPKAYTLPIQYSGAPWRQAINVKSLEAAYESLADTTSQGCNSPSLAAATLTVITSAVTWQNNYGRDTTNRGTYYEVNSQSNDQLTIHHPVGTVSISLTSTALTGVGTNWQTAGYCDGTHFILIEGTVFATYKISSCSSDTAATLSVAYGFFSESGNASAVQYSIAPAASSSCGGSLADWCNTGTGDRNLTRTICGGEGWLYKQTLNPTYLGWTNECVSATLGGPTVGLTNAVNTESFVLPCSGPACDGWVGDTVGSAPSCITTGGAPPCVYGSDIWSNLGKNFGEAFGAPGIDNALGWRLYGTLSPPAITSSSPLPPGTVGSPYSFTFAANGSTPITWGGTGIPAWATLGSSGILAGTPNVAATSTFNITATNSAGSATSPFTLTTGSMLTCDLNHDGQFNVLDVRLMTNQVLGVTACTNNLTQTGTCNVTDIQRVTNAALLFANGQPVVCPTGP